jgi:predicted nucleic acid-binding protein
MIVVADTSPINYLIQIGEIGVLSRLYVRILVPPAVFRELTHPAAPPEVREWALARPAWLEIVNPETSPPLTRLDPGESEGLKVAGTLSVLDDADQAGLLRFDDAVARLRKTSFRLSDAVLVEIMRKRSR